MLIEPRQTVVPPPAPPAPSGAAFGIQVVCDEAALRARRAEWEALAQAAIEPNPFYEPWYLLPALRHFQAGNDLQIVLVERAAAPGAPAQLVGLFPLRMKRLSRFLPVRVAKLWRHRYCFLCAPLLHRDCAAEALGTFFDWLGGPAGIPLWRLELVPGEGPFAQLLTRLCHDRQRPTFPIESYLRALLTVGPNAEEYLTRAMAKKRLREVRRKERWFAGRGRFERRVLAPTDAVGPWIEDFLRLEASGWKGQQGTAFANQQTDAAFFREMAQAAHAAGRLQGIGLYLDDRPIALKVNLLAPPGSFAFKIAFDESYYSQSPGVMLEVANIEHQHGPGTPRWMDSCAVANHPMIDRLWTERRTIQALLLATGRAPGDLLVSLLPVGRWLKRLFRRPAATIHLPADEEQPS